jgi:glycosyltransferase-like protein
VSLSIGVFTYSTKPRGSVVHAAALAEALCAAGQHATLYALHKDGAGFYRELECELRLVPAAPAPAGTDALIAQRIGEFQSYLARERPVHDVLHAQDCLSANALLGVPACRGRVVRTVHHVERFESVYLEQCQNRSIAEADLLLVVSRHTQRDVLARFGRTPPVVGNGVDAGRFRGVDARRVGLRRRALLGARLGPLVLSVGGVEPRKNTLGMLEAFSALRREHPSARWVIAGGASVLDHSAYRQRFEQRLRDDPALAWAVLQTGVLEEAALSELYLAADAFLCASQEEGFGLSVLEAMAAGVPVVAPRGAPFDEFLDEASAVLVDRTDSAAIARGLERALAERSSLQAAARARADACSWSRVAAAHVPYYRDLIRAGAALAHAPQPPLESGAAERLGA